MMRFRLILLLLLAVSNLFCYSSKLSPNSRLKGAFRRPVKNGWIYVHLEGEPEEIGFQHGSLLAKEIVEMQKVIALELIQDTKKPWGFFQEVARVGLWPKIEKEYQEELQGIIAGMKEQGISLGLWDLVVMNAALELNPYFVNWVEKHRQASSGDPMLSTADHFDTFEGRNHPNERTLCGHIELSPRGSLPWQPPYGIAGTVQAKISDSTLAEHMTILAAAGHPCGMRFRVAEHLAAYPQFDWQKPLLRDLDSFPWTPFSATQ